MPTVITRGAASARGYGFGGGAKAVSGFLQTIDSGAYGTNTYSVAYDTDNNMYIGGIITESVFSGYGFIAKLQSGTGLVLWSKTFDASPANNPVRGLAFGNGHLYAFIGSGNKIVKISTDGVIIEAKSVNGSIGFSQTNYRQIDIDSSGNIYVMGTTYDPTYSYRGVSIVKLNSSYAVQWNISFHRAGASLDLDPNTLRVGLDGNIVFSANAGGSPNRVMVGIVSSSTGSATYARLIGNNLAYGDFTTDASGNLYGISSDTSSAGTLVFKSTPASFSWQKLIPYVGGNYDCMRIDSSGNVYGFITGNGNGYVFKLDPSGSTQWIKNGNTFYGYFGAGLLYNPANDLLYGTGSTFSGDYANSFQFPAKNGPRNGTYTSKSIVLSSVSPTVTTPTYTINTVPSLTITSQTVNINNSSATFYNYTLPTTSNATVLSA